MDSLRLNVLEAENARAAEGAAKARRESMLRARDMASCGQLTSLAASVLEVTIRRR